MTKYIVPLCQSFGTGLAASWHNQPEITTPEVSPGNNQPSGQTLRGLERMAVAMERLAGQGPVATLGHTGEIVENSEVNKAVQEIETLGKQIGALVEAVVQRPSSAVAGIAPECLSREDAALFLGVPVKTVEYLITSRKLRYVQVGQQRGRSIAVADLKKFAEVNTVKTAEEMLAKNRRH